MTRYALIHLKKPAAMSDFEYQYGAHVPALTECMMGRQVAARELVDQGFAQVVAIVEAQDPEDLFARTNSIDALWTEVHPPLKGKSEQRSTSVGDFIVDLETDKVLFCASIGWSPAIPSIATILRAAAHSFDQEN